MKPQGLILQGVLFVTLSVASLSGCVSSSPSTSNNLGVSTSEALSRESCPESFSAFILAHYPDILDELSLGRGRYTDMLLRRSGQEARRQQWIEVGRSFVRATKTPQQLACELSTYLGARP